MYTLMPARPLSLSVCSGTVGRSSWRGGAGIIKPWRGTSGTPLSAIRGSSQCMLIFLGPMNARPGLFSIGTWGRTWPARPPPQAAYSGCWYWVKQTLSQGCPVGHRAKEANGSHMWRLPKERQWGLISHSLHIPLLLLTSSVLKKSQLYLRCSINKKLKYHVADV